MRKLYFSFFFLLFAFSHKAQNLVPNPSFENYSLCPTILGQIHRAVPWFQNWNCNQNPLPNCGSSDYFNQCSAANGAGVPKNPISFQYARTGGAYAGIILGDPFNMNYREYIEVLLNNSLKSNKKYCGSIYLSVSNVATFFVDAVGMYFSKDSILTPVPPSNYLLSFTPQVQNPAANFLSDTLNWMPVGGIFTAQGDERILTIGNFKDDASTGRMTGYGAWDIYYFIDDVSVVELPEAAELTGGDKVICPWDSVLLGTTQKLNVSYKWQGQSITGSTDSAHIWVKPGMNTTYTLTVSDTSVICPNSSTATVTIIVNDCPLPKEKGDIFVPTAFSPNGDNNNDVLYVYGKNIKELEFAVYNRWGEKIYEGRFTDYDLKNGGFETWDGKYKNENTEQGVYVWYAKVKFKDGGEKTYKGNVTLVR